MRASARLAPVVWLVAASCGGEARDAHDASGGGHDSTGGSRARGGSDATSGGSGATSGGSGATSGGSDASSGGATAPGSAGGQVSNLHTGEGCPTAEPRGGEACAEQGLECFFTSCAGATERAWVCDASRWISWQDPPCGPAPGCPAEAPAPGSPCVSAVECTYTTDCCDGAQGFIAFQCRGTSGGWHVSRGSTSDCARCDPFPVAGTPCSTANACVADAPPALCLLPGCEGGVASARCVDDVWLVDSGCDK